MYYSKRLLRIVVFLCAGGAWLNGAYAEDAVPERAALQPIRFEPGFYPLMPWDPQHGWKEPYVERVNGLESIAACGFTMAGFVHASDLPLCEKLGLKAILAPPSSKEPWFGPWRDLSDEQIEQRVRAMIDAGGDSPALVGYFLTDEPGTPSFAALGKAVAAVKKHAPGKLAYINLFPSYATIGAPDKSQLGAASFTEYLERFVSEVRPQFLSYDNYMVQHSDDMLSKPGADNYYYDLMEVRRVAAEHGLPFWNIVSSNQIRKNTPPPSPANMFLQAYTTLAAGGRGLSWYTYYGGGYAYAPIDKDGGKTATWHTLRMVNHHVRTLGPILNRLRSTGVYTTSPSPAPALPTLPGRLVRNVVSMASVRDRSEVHPPIMVGEFASDEGADYVMLVNLSLERSTNVTLETARAYAQKEVLSPDDGRAQPLNEEHGLWLPAGQGALIKLRP